MPRVFDTPWTRSEIGIGDLLLIAAIAHHARCRGRSLASAATPGALGFVFGNLTFAIAQPADLPLVPFLLLGWAATEAVAQLASSTGRASRSG